MSNREEDATVTQSEIRQSLTEADRAELIKTHPVLEREYMLPTPMMELAYSIIRERVWARRTGAVFYATPRMGKTRCAAAVKGFLEEEFPNLYVTLLSAHGLLRANDCHMYKSILDAEDHVLSRRNDKLLLRDNIVSDIQLKTREKGGAQYVLLIDEIQALSDTDLHNLSWLHNAFDKKKIRMTTISFGQPQILHRRTALMAAGEHQIIARFLSEPLHFNGCSSVADLRQLLVSFDTGSEYPEGSGWSYTRFFMPLAFENGFRLAAFAADIWRGLVSAAGTGGATAIPMEHTCLTIENILLVMRRQDCSTLTLDAADIDSAVASSQLQSFLLLADNVV